MEKAISYLISTTLRSVLPTLEVSITEQDSSEIFTFGLNIRDVLPVSLVFGGLRSPPVLVDLQYVVCLFLSIEVRMFSLAIMFQTWVGRSCFCQLDCPGDCFSMHCKNLEPKARALVPQTVL